MKKNVIMGIFMVSLMIGPWVSLEAQQTSSDVNRVQPDPYDDPMMQPIGAFRIVIYPPTDVFQRFESREIQGVHQLVPGILETVMPRVWMYQLSELDCVSSPDWVEVTFPETNIITPPDGLEHNFSFVLTVHNDAPANAVGTISIQITTGKMIRKMFPHIPLFGEFNLDQEFVIRTGDW